jgi:predicted SAM-dependent methyltransferase
MKLNLGCGQNLIPGYINVDKYGDPDVLHDLETFPWPWEDNSVDEIRLTHVLEHLGETTATYFKIIQELYRISKPNGLIFIVVPHPRHDDFLGDPTHIRPITARHLLLFSRKYNYECQQKHYADSPLGLYLNVDFEIVNTQYNLEDIWFQQFQNGKVTKEILDMAINNYNNIVKEIAIDLKVVKPLSVIAS